MKNNSNFFERIMKIAEYHGFSSINNFAITGLGYKSSEKLNRLKDGSKSPSVDIIVDISNKFEAVNTLWILTGKGEMLLHNTSPPAVPEEVLLLKDKIIALQDEVIRLNGVVHKLQEALQATKSTELIVPKVVAKELIKKR